MAVSEKARKKNIRKLEARRRRGRTEEREGKESSLSFSPQTAMSSSQDYANVAGGSLKLKGAGGSKK